jgi:uncharacterized membrane protein
MSVRARYNATCIPTEPTQELDRSTAARPRQHNTVVCSIESVFASRWTAMIELDRHATHHPAVLEQWAKRREDAQLRIADKITAFAGSMPFVYLHAALFAAWMLFLEERPWPTLTLVVSLEAIFLSTFVMIGQNRQAAFQQAKADHDYKNMDKLLDENTELTRVIHQMTQELHQHVLGS